MLVHINTTTDNTHHGTYIHNNDGRHDLPREERHSSSCAGTTMHRKMYRAVSWLPSTTSSSECFSEHKERQRRASQSNKTKLTAATRTKINKNKIKVE